MENKKKFKIFIFIFVISLFFNIYFLISIVNKSNYDIVDYESISLNNLDINIFKNYYDKFKEVESYAQYIDGYNIFGNDLFLGFIIRLNDIESFKKFWLYKYEYYINEKDYDFIKDIEKYNISSGKEFTNFISADFNNLVNSKINKLEDLDYDKGDIYVNYNNLSMEDSLKACFNLKNKYIEKYLYDGNSCEDKAYAFRATSKNKYCEKISDPYKIKLCNDFLKYTNQ